MGKDGFNDAYAFFTRRRSTGSLLPLDAEGGDAPVEVPALAGDDARSIGFLVNDRFSTNPIVRFKIENLSINAREKNSEQAIADGGPALVLGWVLDLALRSCILKSGCHAFITSMGGPNVYTISARDTNFLGSYIPIYIQNTIMSIDEAYDMGFGYKYNIVMSGSRLSIRNMFFLYPGSLTNYILATQQVYDNGPNGLVIDGLMDDNEGSPNPSEAWIRADNCDRLIVSNSEPAQLPRSGHENPEGGCFAVLGRTRRGYVDIRSSPIFTTSNSQGRAIVKVESPNWYGKVEGWSQTDSPLLDDDAAGGHRIETLSRNYAFGVPTAGTWGVGAVSRCISAPPGAAIEFSCSSRGRYGTGTLPSWSVSRTHYAPNSNSLAAYIASGLAFDLGQSSEGYVLQPAAHDVLKSLFGGANRTPPRLHLGLCSNWLDRTGLRAAELKAEDRSDGKRETKPTATGYKRSPAEFALASGKWTLQAEALFGPSLQAWNVHRFGNSEPSPRPIPYWILADGPTGENRIAWGQLKSPLEVSSSGKKVSLPARGLGVENAASNLGGWTTHGFDEVVSLVLGSKPRETPRQWLIGLSSNPVKLDGTGATEPKGSGYRRDFAQHRRELQSARRRLCFEQNRDRLPEADGALGETHSLVLGRPLRQNLGLGTAPRSRDRGLGGERASKLCARSVHRRTYVIPSSARGTRPRPLLVSNSREPRAV